MSKWCKMIYDKFIHRKMLVISFSVQYIKQLCLRKSCIVLQWTIYNNMASKLKNDWNIISIYHQYWSSLCYKFSNYLQSHFDISCNKYGGYYYVFCIVDNIHTQEMFHNMPNMASIEKREKKIKWIRVTLYEFLFGN